MIGSLHVSLIVEVTLLALLAATLYFCMRLDGRLRNLHKDQENLSGTVRSLNAAIGAAQASLAGLRAAAREADENLGRKVSAARGLADELSLLTSAGDRIAGRFESARSHQAPQPKRNGLKLGEAIRAAR